MRNRFFIMGLLGLLLLLLMGYGAFSTPWVTWDQASARPEFYDGKEINLFVFPKIVERDGQGFWIQEAGKAPVRVWGDTVDMKPGEYIGLRAIFHRDGTLTATHAEVARRRREKIGLSLLAFLAMGYAWIRTFRWNPKTRMIETRHA